MTSENSIKKLDYSMEWVDHIFALYSDFKRRNDMNEWAYFLGRPELSDPKETEKIAEQIMEYVVKLPNISQKIAEMLEDTFKYSESRTKYEDKFGYENIEYFFKRNLGAKEFPPYELFGQLEYGAPYDQFIGAFYEIYFTGEVEDEDPFNAKLDELRGMGIVHPYTALLDSKAYEIKEDWGNALQCLSQMDDCYHKNISMGLIFFNLEDYESAEACLQVAYALNEGFYDNALIVSLVVSKWQNGKREEALETANAFAVAGYEHNVLPLKYSFLEEFSEMIAEKAKSSEPTEEEFLILKEYCLMKNDYDSVKNLCHTAWEKKFSDSSWTVDMAEAFFETGEMDNAYEIVDMVYSGKKLLDKKATLKIRELKARLLFSEGKIEEAYDIMDSVFKSEHVTSRQKMLLAQMYKRTGRLKAAIRILNELYYNAPYNLEFSYELGKFLLDAEEPAKAYYHFKNICTEVPEFRNAAYYVVQATIDRGVRQRVWSQMRLYGKYIPDEYTMYINGQLAEMKENFKEAEDIYSDMIDRYKKKPYDRKLFCDAATRYFLMRQENGARAIFFVKEIEDALKIIPDAADVWYFLGDLHERVDIKEGAAEECYKKALEADPYHVPTMIALISLYGENDKNNQALELLNKAIIYTDDPDMYLLRAHTALYMDKMDLCLSDIGEYERRCGANDEVAELNAKILMKNCEYEKALEQFEIMMRKKNVKTEPYYDSLAICMCKCGRYDEAEDLLEAVCQNSKNDIFHMFLYEIQMYCGKFKDAKYTLKRFKERCSTGLLDERITLMSAYIMLESGNAIFGKALAETIPSVDGERLCAVLELVNKNYRTAVRLFKKLVKKQDDHVDNYSWLALALYSQGKKQEAANCAYEGLALLNEYNGSVDNVKIPDVLCQYAFLKTMREEFDEAERIYNIALSLPTCSAYICNGCYEAHFGKGVLYGCSGQHKKALEEFNKSLEIRGANYICKKIKKWL